MRSLITSAGSHRGRLGFAFAKFRRGSFRRGLARSRPRAPTSALRSCRARDESSRRRRGEEVLGVDRPGTPTSPYYAVNPIPCILDIKFSAGLLLSSAQPCYARESQSARSKAFLFVSQCLCHVHRKMSAYRRASRQFSRRSPRARHSYVTPAAAARHREKRSSRT